jgi:hypothetical protein
VRAVLLLDQVEAHDSAGVSLALGERPLEDAPHPVPIVAASPRRDELDGEVGIPEPRLAQRGFLPRPAPELDVLHVVVDQLVEHPAPVAAADARVGEEAPQAPEAIAELLPDVGRVAILLSERDRAEEILVERLRVCCFAPECFDLAPGALRRRGEEAQCAPHDRPRVAHEHVAIRALGGLRHEPVEVAARGPVHVQHPALRQASHDLEQGRLLDQPLRPVE